MNGLKKDKYYLATKNCIFLFEKTWIYLKGIELSEISQIEKDQPHEISPICETQITTTNHSK